MKLKKKIKFDTIKRFCNFAWEKIGEDKNYHRSSTMPWWLTRAGPPPCRRWHDASKTTLEWDQRSPGDTTHVIQRALAPLTS